jgi:hypothetical protein
MVLSREQKLPTSPVPGTVDSGRRDFLVRCCQGASAALVPAGLRGLRLRSLEGLDSAERSPSNHEFDLHPHYRMPRSLDALLLKAQAGLDNFVTEQYADQIAAVLAQWSAGLLRSPGEILPIDKALAPDFAGCFLRPRESRVVRPGPPIEVRVNSFEPDATLARDKFLGELRTMVGGFRSILTAEFQITSIELGSTPEAQLSAGQIQTRIRYELVATRDAFDREQRVGSSAPPMLTSQLRRLATMRPTLRSFCMAPTTGGPCSTVPVASTSTGTTAFRLATSMATD